MAASKKGSIQAQAQAQAAESAEEKSEGAGSPVLTLIFKRLRAARKKLNRITETESAVQAGKELNADQVRHQSGGDRRRAVPLRASGAGFAPARAAWVMRRSGRWLCVRRRLRCGRVAPRVLRHRSASLSPGRRRTS
jgi:hypothetical protein